jgi:NADH-quinone oxidoreductase subunit H
MSLLLALFLAAAGFVFWQGFGADVGFGWMLLSAAIPWFFVLNMIPPMIWMERKGSAYIQDRVGPERAFIPGLGLRVAGLVHNLADVVKLATKEELLPKHVNRTFYVLAPMLSMTVALLVGAVVPFCHEVHFADGFVFRAQALDLNVGLLWFLSMSSIGVYSVALAGWSSNNKYGQLGGLRASASMISYETVLGLSVATAFLVYGSTSLNDMVQGQFGTFLGAIPRWGICTMPVGFVLYMIAALAETNRSPFDLAEAESELVAGFHTEYGAFKFALFFMAEYVAIVVQALIVSTIFLGGWQPLPWDLLHHDWLVEPEHAALVLRWMLGGTAVLAGAFGCWCLRWHRTNRLRWKDSRKNEGVVLAMLLGFAPALAALAALLLWGGPSSADGGAVVAAVVEFSALAGKTLFLCWVFIWVRWTVPRFRYDQLMHLGWKLLIPLGLVNLIGTAVLVKTGVL